MIFGAIEFLQSVNSLKTYEVYFSEGYSTFTNVSIHMEANHTYQLHIEIVASEHTKFNELNATIEGYINGEFVAERHLYKSIYQVEEESESIMTHADIIFTPESDSDLLVSVYNIQADSWTIWIYKDLPPYFIYYPSMFLIIILVGLGITVIYGSKFKKLINSTKK